MPRKIIAFTASWCGPCKQQKPILAELEENYTVEYVDIDEDMDVANEYNVRSVPTTVIEVNGEPVKQFTGLTQKEDIEAELNRKV